MISLSTYLRCLLAYQALTTTTAQIVYSGYKVYRFTPQTEEHVKLLLQLQDAGVRLEDVDFWTGPSPIGKPSDAMFAPHQQGDILNAAVLSGMKHKVYVSDVQDLLKKERVGKARVSGLIDWEQYYRLDDIYAFLDKMASESPSAEVVTYGQSYECRELKLMKIAKACDGSGRKPAVLIEANVTTSKLLTYRNLDCDCTDTHAREWISNAVATYLINDILTGTLQERQDEFDFYIVPVANPDGYEFSHETDRFWRKTRSITSNSRCPGVDPNRNWDIEWEHGAKHPCTASYIGTKPFSESEVLSLAEFHNKTVADRVHFFLSIHSYSQVFIIPWSYTKEHSPDYDRYMKVTTKAAAALEKVSGTKYRSGTAFDTIGYLATGTSADWMYGVPPEAKLSITAELRDNGECGFVLPPEQIIPTAVEFIAALNVFLDHINSY